MTPPYKGTVEQIPIIEQIKAAADRMVGGCVIFSLDYGNQDRIQYQYDYMQSKITSTVNT